MSGERPLLVVRPSVPPIAWLAGGAWLGCLLAEDLAWRAYAASRSVSPWTVVGAIILVVASVYALQRWPRLGVGALVVAGLAGGLAVGSIWWASAHGSASSAAADPVRELTGTVTDEPAAQEGTSRVFVAVPRLGTVQVSTPGTLTVLPGQTVRLRGRFTAPDPKDAWGRVEHRRGIVGEVRAWKVTEAAWAPGPAGRLYALRARAAPGISGVPGEGGALLASVVLGDGRRVAGTSLEQDVRTAGLAHLLSASALYVAALCGGIVLALRRLRAPRWFQALGGMSAAFAFAASAGWRPSLVRALLMLLLALGAPLLKRRADPLAALGTAALAAVLLWPPAACDLGLALGAAAVAGVVLLGPLLGAWFRASVPRPLKGVARAAAIVVSLQLATLPLVSAAFGVVPLTAPVSSLAAAVPATAGLAVGSVGSVLVATGLPGGGMALRVSAWLFGCVAWLAHRIAAMPFAALPVGEWTAVTVVAFVAALVGLWAWWPTPRDEGLARRTVLVAAALAAVVVWMPPPGGAALVVMDVGQGDAILLRDGAATMLVDTGPTPQALRSALARLRIRRVDCMVLTHDHADHTGGLKGLEGVASVGWIGVPVVAEPNAFAGVRREAARLAPQRPDRLRSLAAGASWRLGETDVRVVWPVRAVEGADPNDTSVVLLLTRHGVRALLTGDAECDSQTAVSQVVSAAIDVLKVGHHGSRNGYSDSALGLWRPRLALISVGAGNDFGHPHAEALAALDAVGSGVHRTDLEGDLTVSLSGTGWSVRTSRGARRSACATIGSAAIAALGPAPCPYILENDGLLRPERSQARLPDLWGRRAVARTRGPPAA